MGEGIAICDAKWEVMRSLWGAGAFVYYPQASEEACVRSEMRRAFSRIYGGRVNRDSPHFSFCGMDDNDSIDLCSEALESSLALILEDLRCQDPGEVRVHIHQSRTRLHSALGVAAAPDWLRAGWAWGIIHILPASYFPDPRACLRSRRCPKRG